MTIALSLFDLPVDTPAHGGARKADPPTSVAAAKDPTSMVRWGSQRHKLLCTFAVKGDAGLTDEEAGIRCGIARVADTRRCSELRKAGLIVNTGQTRTTQTGAPAMVCRITDLGRKVLAESREAQR